MRHLSLFSGIGGIDLAAEWAGFHTVAFVEKDPFCQKVLAKHWPEVPIHGDIQAFTAKDVAHTNGDRSRKERGNDGEVRGVPQAECKPELGTDLSRGSRTGIDLLSGGFPCQPFSVAGKRKGSGDERFLWDEMLRVIREVHPLWVLGENVRGLLSIDGGRTFGTILHELAEVGYRVGWGVYGACHVGAPHRRERVFIVANSNGGGTHPKQERVGGSCGSPHIDWDGETQPLANSTRDEQGWQEQRAEWERVGSCCESKPLADPKVSGRRQGDKNPRGSRQGATKAQEWARPPNDSGWKPEPNVGRVADGIPRRVDRLRALGNAVVPQQVYPILQAIADEIRRAA